MEFKEGDAVWYRGSFGREPAKAGVIHDFGEENSHTVYDVDINDGESCWGYASQFTKREV